MTGLLGTGGGFDCCVSRVYVSNISTPLAAVAAGDHTLARSRGSLLNVVSAAARLFRPADLGRSVRLYQTFAVMFMPRRGWERCVSFRPHLGGRGRTSALD